MIQNSQTAASISAEDAKTARGTGKPTLPAPPIDNTTRKKDKNKNNTGVARMNQGFCYFVVSMRHFNYVKLAR